MTKPTFLRRSWYERGAPSWYQQVPSWIMLGRNTTIAKENGEWLWVSGRCRNPFAAFGGSTWILDVMSTRQWLKKTGWRGAVAIVCDMIGVSLPIRWICRRSIKDLDKPLFPAQRGEMRHESIDAEARD